MRGCAVTPATGYERREIRTFLERPAFQRSPAVATADAVAAPAEAVHDATAKLLKI